ncbi:MAG TPA: hypothetical protein VKL40_00840 [Candidatus Angelobacter sp.]|nr:hypothetical protein [Candidatus Angelobacter sp.]
MSSRRMIHITLCMGLALVALNGCSVSTHHDSASGQDKDVDIKTPLGSLSVHKGATDPKDTGLALYPGAQLKKDMDGEGGANVNISSSFFGVKVVALKYQSNDAPEKILAFYRKDMAKYGKVLDCGGGFSMNYHRRDKDEEVTCDRDHGSGHDYSQELKVGTENNQRIVAIKPSGSGSEFALVYVRAWDDKSTL